jgi:hypothetical protein
MERLPSSVNSLSSISLSLSCTNTYSLYLSFSLLVGYTGSFFFFFFSSFSLFLAFLYLLSGTRKNTLSLSLSFFLPSFLSFFISLSLSLSLSFSLSFSVWLRRQINFLKEQWV